MISTRPYLIRSFYEWIVDSDCTPHIVVNATLKDVTVPREFVDQDGQIVLNISMPAVQNLVLDNESVNFQARFGGVAHDVYVPIKAVTAIYARENGRGMVFTDEDDDVEPPPKKEAPSGKSKGSHLTVIK